MDLFDDTTHAPKIKKWRPPGRRGPGRPRKDPEPTVALVMEGTFAVVVRAFKASAYWSDQIKENTRKGWGRELDLLAESPKGLGRIPVEQMRPKLVQDWLDGFPDRPGKQHACLNALKRLEKWALVKDLLSRSITTGCTIIRSKKGRKPWSDEQIAYGIATAPEHFARAIALGANTGQRPSDLVRMRWIDLETINGHLGINITTKKVELPLWIPFTHEFERVVMEWEREWRGSRVAAPTILTGRDGQPWNERNMSSGWSKQTRFNPKLAQLRGYSLHGLRASACVKLMRLGATTRAISDMIGLAEAMVARYCRLASRKESASATILLLDGARTKEGKRQNDTA